MFNLICKLALVISFICLLLTFSALARAESIPEDVAVHCILGEARLEFTRYGYDAFLSIAEALRNRGTTEGVYGCKPRWGLSPAQYKIDFAWLVRYDGEAQARRAWRQAKHSNLVKGATHWEGSQYNPPYWVKDMAFVIEIAGTKFYKPEKRR